MRRPGASDAAPPGATGAPSIVASATTGATDAASGATDGGWPPGQAAAVVALAALCFATSGPLARVAAPAHPLLIAAGRTALASALLGLWAPRASLRAVAALS
ncbi:MAG: hypothetical protein EOO75_20675, partial [Myxococcales bacterium]